MHTSKEAQFCVSRKSESECPSLECLQNIFVLVLFSTRQEFSPPPEATVGATPGVIRSNLLDFNAVVYDDRTSSTPTLCPPVGLQTVP